MLARGHFSLELPKSGLLLLKNGLLLHLFIVISILILEGQLWVLFDSVLKFIGLQSNYIEFFVLFFVDLLIIVKASPKSPRIIIQKIGTVVREIGVS